MNRTHLRDLEQSRTLCRREVSLELQRPLDTIKSSRLRLAFRAVCGVNPGVLKSDGHFLQRSLLSSRVQRDRHRRSTAQRSQEEVVRRGAGIGAAVRNRFVCRETMVTRRDRLGESLCGAPNGHSRFVRCVVGVHGRQSQLLAQRIGGRSAPAASREHRTNSVGLALRKSSRAQDVLFRDEAQEACHRA